MIKKFKGRKVYAKFKDNTSAEELAEIRSLSSKNEAYYMWLMLSPNMHELNLWKINKEKAFFH